MPAILRRHADSRPPPVHPSRQPVQRFSKWQFSVRDRARHNTFLEQQTYLIPKPKHPSQRWSCSFLSQHLIPILLHSAKSAGQLQNRQNPKTPSPKTWSFPVETVFLAGDRAQSSTLWGAFSGAPHFRHKVVWGSGKSPHSQN